MKIDLTRAAGFPLSLDTDANDLTAAGDVRFDRLARRASELASVLFEPDGLAPATELYWLFPLRDAGSAAPALDRVGLTYSCVLLPSLKVGREYVKTQGHYHPAMPGSAIPYPEVYTHLWGESLLLLQRPAAASADRIVDCAVVALRDGTTVTIPPGYAHILINPSPRPAVVAGLYSRAFAPVYQPISELAGAAYYLVDEAGQRAVPNPRYPDRPPLRWLADLAGTPFAPPDGDRPLWTSFLGEPARYDFLSDAEAARLRFPVEGEAP
jgi:glucose-6-phosphate isomerase